MSSFVALRDQFAHLLAGAVDLRLDGAQRQGELGGDLLVGVFVEEAHDDQRPVTRRQPFEVMLDLGPLLDWPVTVYTDSKKAVRDMDAVMCLRLQLERQQAGLLPDLREYSKRFCLTTAHMELARPGAHIMHPGPILRGLDVSDALADSSQSLILDQVSAGVSVRMAVLYLLATRPDIKDNL